MGSQQVLLSSCGSTFKKIHKAESLCQSQKLLRKDGCNKLFGKKSLIRPFSLIIWTFLALSSASKTITTTACSISFMLPVLRARLAQAMTAASWTDRSGPARREGRRTRMPASRRESWNIKFIWRFWSMIDCELNLLKIRPFNRNFYIKIVSMQTVNFELNILDAL